MTDLTAKSGRPESAAIAWAGKDAIFVEYPVKGGGPNYIVRMHKTAEGLQQALNILLENPAPAPKLTAQANHPTITRAQSRVPNASDESRAQAAAIVRRLFK